MNVQLLEDIMRAIVAFPRQFDMDIWGDPSEVRYLKTHIELGELCGTPCCLAGHALLMSGLPVVHTLTEPIPYQAARLLEISVQTDLFSDAAWPSPYRFAYDRSQVGSLRRARITAARIRLYILTNETDDVNLYRVMKHKRREQQHAGAGRGNSSVNVASSVPA